MSNHDENPVVAPAELDELAERAQELARAIEAAGAARGVARALTAAASDLSLGPGARSARSPGASVPITGRR